MNWTWEVYTPWWYDFVKLMRKYRTSHQNPPPDNGGNSRYEQRGPRPFPVSCQDPYMYCKQKDSFVSYQEFFFVPNVVVITQHTESLCEWKTWETLSTLGDSFDEPTFVCITMWVVCQTGAIQPHPSYCAHFGTSDRYSRVIGFGHRISMWTKGRARSSSETTFFTPYSYYVFGNNFPRE